MNKRALFVVLSILLIGVCTPIPLVCAQADWLEGWSNRIDIIIDSGDVDEILTDFPVLVYLNSSRITWSAVQDDLDDLRFCDEDSTVLKYEIDDYTVNDEAWLWVKIPTISNTSNTVFTLFYNNTEAIYGEDPENVWDAHFTLVCHMNDDPDTSTVKDSTDHDNDGGKAGANSPTETVTGKIGNGQDFDALDDEINFGGDASLDVDDKTFQLWIKCDNEFDGDGPLMSKGLWSWKGAGYRYYTASDEMEWRISYKPNGIISDSLRYTFSPITATWYFLCGTYNISTTVMQLQANDNYQSKDTGKTMYDQGYDLIIDNYNHHDGPLDEIRASDVARSSAWMKADYETQRDDILFFGSETSRPILSLTNFNFIIVIVALSLSVTAFLGISNKRRR